MKRNLLLVFPGVLFFYVSYTQPTNSIPGDTYAIVVGISKYHYIKPLSYADRDAELFSQVLMSRAGGSIKPENILLLKNDSANAGNFWSGISRLCNQKLKKNDRVYIYFAGHGDAVKGLNEYYLLLSDCQPANDGNNYLLSLGAIDMYHLKNRIGLLTEQGVEVILVLDACRTNELPGGYASQVFKTNIIQANVGDITMLATSPGQVSLEHTSFGNGHGIFTYNLVDGLSGRADREGEGNNDQIISLAEINKWVTLNVTQSSEKFKVKQNPVFCCVEKNNTVIGMVDSNFSVKWNTFKALSKNNEGYPADIKSNRSGITGTDSVVLSLYNKFNEARKQNLLWGENSANEFYDQLHGRFPGDKITEDARYILAADFINFAQQKINLYLEGRDLYSLEIIAEKTGSSKATGFLNDEYNRIKKTVSEKWTVAGLMVRKAGMLLSTINDSSILVQLRPKINFLLSRGFLNGEKENKLRYDEAFQMALASYNADSSAAYTAECLALLYAYKATYGVNARWENPDDVYGGFGETDAALHYFNKSISIAPAWVSPYRSIGVKLYGINRIDTAAMYLRKALEVDPKDGSTYILFGDLYRYRFHDSSTAYYKQALNFVPKMAWADIYYKIGRNFISSLKIKDLKLKTDSALHYSYKTLSVNPIHLEALSSIGNFYELHKKNDSALFFYRKALHTNPASTFIYVSIIKIFTETKQPDSILFYCNRMLKIIPESGYAFHTIAEYYYNQQGYADSAIAYYKLAMAAGYSTYEAIERTAYLLMKKEKTDTLPLTYFTRLLNGTPSSWRNYYNIACYYSNRQEVVPAIEFLEKALQGGMRNKKQIETDSFLVSIRETDAYRKLMTLYFP